jgi:hypothetical protein
MNRRVFTILSAVSALAFVAVLLMWVVAILHERPGRLRRVEREGACVRIINSVCGWTRHGVIVDTEEMHHLFGQTYDSNFRLQGEPTERDVAMAAAIARDPNAGINLSWNGSSTNWRWPDSRLQMLGSGSYARCGFLLTMPFYWPLAAASLLPAAWLLVWVISYRRQDRRKRLGLCLNCGYDLRASEGRCPECGTRTHDGRMTIDGNELR